MSYKWKPSKAAARDFAEKMADIAQFCADNGIRQSLAGDSYYFDLAGVRYRVSNHTVTASNKGAYNADGVQVRELYHPDGEAGMICITAGKTRIIDIYNDLAAGYKLDRRGNRIN
jgi:hypothetical protein